MKRLFLFFLIVVPLCISCGKSQQQGNESANDSVAKQREALAEFRQMVKERDKLQKLAPCVFYRVLREGEGAIPTDSSMVTIHYEGRLKNGQIFDSSYDRNEPWTVRTKETIEGWRDVLTHMPCGSKWFVLIYYDKAYGDQSVAGIPAFSNLYFTMELLEVGE